MEKAFNMASLVGGGGFIHGGLGGHGVLDIGFDDVRFQVVINSLKGRHGLEVGLLRFGVFSGVLQSIL